MHNKYNYGEIKYFRFLHRARQRQMGQEPVSYVAFFNRLKKGMVLKEAIYTPSDTKMVRNRINMKPKKKHLLKSFISLIKKTCQKKGS